MLRRRSPDAPRPYRAWGYPIVPALYVVAASALMIDLLIVKPTFTWPGLLIALSGVPVYYWTTTRHVRAQASYCCPLLLRSRPELNYRRGLLR